MCKKNNATGHRSKGGLIRPNTQEVYKNFKVIMYLVKMFYHFELLYFAQAKVCKCQLHYIQHDEETRVEYLQTGIF